MKRILSAVIAVILLCGMILPLCTFGASALGDEKLIESLKTISDYRKEKYINGADKLATMTKVVDNGKFALYIQEYTTEVCVVDLTTGQMLFTNPYDVAYTTTGSDVFKYQLLSQILLEYSDNQGMTKTLNSFADAVTNDQAVIKPIKNGIRVEYAIGEAVKKRIVPRQISKEAFEEKILRPFYEKSCTGGISFNEYIQLRNYGTVEEQRLAGDSESFDFGAFISLYTYYDAASPNITARDQAEMLTQYPITEKTPIYVIPEKVQKSTKQIEDLEKKIKKYTDYSLNDLMADHEEVGYQLEAESPAVFNLSLEYTLTDEGVQVRLPSRGISFDTSAYKLNYISILPYMGAGRTGAKDSVRYDTGYNFVPDGSGAIVSFDQNPARTQISGTIYGNDFGFYRSTNGATANYRTWNFPVFGTVRNATYRYNEYLLDENGEYVKDEEGKLIPTEEIVENTNEGYLAIITEGESLTRIDSVNGGSQHDYHSVYATVFPRQTDSYPLSGISVSGSVAMYTKEIERRYVGNYTIQYKLLWEKDANYVGMANSYRDYLLKKGGLKKNNDNSSDISLILDLLGDIDTTKKVLGIPFDTKTAITSFEDAEKIISELSDEGIKNQVIRYLGWANGGMRNEIATKVKPEKALGGEKGLKSLMEFAATNQVKLFMDFDLAYVKRVEAFDGYDDKYALKTLDGKNAFLREYNAATQSYHHRVAEIMSSYFFRDFYAKITEKYSAYFGDGEKNISLASLGSALDSSQDEDYPINRENAKEYVSSVLKTADNDYDNVMISTGNAYTWGASDYITGIALDSSNRNNFTAEIPFIGIVLHGYVTFSGEAINLAGDYEYTLLKTVENGAVPYFILGYENTSELKTNGYSKYYAVNYSTWKENIVKEYNRINSALKLVKNEIVTEHETVASRVVKVTYSNGVQIYLNYNSFEVKLPDGSALGALDFKAVNK